MTSKFLFKKLPSHGQKSIVLYLVACPARRMQYVHASRALNETSLCIGHILLLVRETSKLGSPVQNASFRFKLRA